MAKKKHPDYDAMSDKEKKAYVLQEMKQDLKRGDRYALTRICEMWNKEEIIMGLFDGKNIDTPKWNPKLKISSMIFILDLWDKWDRQNVKSSNRRYTGRSRQEDRNGNKTPAKNNQHIQNQVR